MKTTISSTSRTASPAAKTKLAAVIVASASLLQIATPAIAAPEYTWAESYGFKSYGIDGKPTEDPFYGSGFDVPVGIAKMPDGGYVVAAQLDLPELYVNVNSAHTSEHSCAGIIRFAADGTIVWQRVLRQSDDRMENGKFVPSSSHVYQIAVDAQGNIFISGGKGNTSNGGQQPFVAKFSDTGVLIWDKGIHDGIWKVADANNNPVIYNEGITAFTTMALTNDGGVIVGASEGKPADGVNYTRPVIAKYNGDGSLALHTVYELNVRYLGVSAVGQAKNSANYVFAIQFPGNDLGGLGMTLVEIAPDGQVLRELVFSPDDNRFETPLQIVATNDGGIATLSQLAKGFSGGTIYDAGGFLLRKFDSNLSVTFQKRIERLGATSGFYANHLSLLFDGGFLVAGRNTTDVQNDIGFSEVSLTRVSATGQLLSVSTLGGPKSEGVSNYGPSSGVFAVQAADGGYAFTTASDSYGEVLNSGFSGRPDIWVAKTDVNRRIPNFADDMRELQLTQFNVRNVVQTGDKAGITRVSPDVVIGATQTSQPAFLLENPATNGAPNAPTIKYQAAPVSAEPMPPVVQFTVKSSPISTDPVTYDSHKRWRFEAIDTATIAGMTLRVQYSKEVYSTAESNVEATWTDLPDGGQMTLVDAVTGYWRLETTGVVPEVQEVAQFYYFRVLATAPGYLTAIGPAQSIADRLYISHSPLKPAPTVSITAPSDGATFAENSNVPFNVSATSPDYGVRSIAFYDNGRVIARSIENATLANITPGLHVLSAIATDNAGQDTIATAVTIFVNVNGGTDYRFTAASGDWSNPANWTPVGVPGANDSARIQQGVVTVSQATTVRVVSLEGGVISGPGELTVTKHFTATRGQTNGLPLTIGPDAIGEAVGEDAIGFSGTMTNNGTFFAAADITGFASGTNAAGAGAQSVSPDAFGFDFGFLKNIGRFFSAPKPRKAASSPNNPAPVVIRFNNFQNIGSLINQDGASLINQDGASLTAPNGYAATAPTGFTQDSGELDLGPNDPLQQGHIFGRVTINGGSVTGSGIINGSLINNGGFISPGHSAGTIEVTGTFTQAAGGTTITEVASGTNFDRILVDGATNLAGALKVNVAHPEQLNNPTTVTPFSLSNVSGSFTSVSSNAKLTLNAFTADVSVDPTVTPPRPGQPVNIATRLAVQTGDDVLFAGFIVTGPSGSTKKVLIRGLGPSLPVPGTLADPLLELNNPDGSKVVNDNWKEGDTSQIPAGFGPSSDNESVLVATLTVGGSGYSNYTAILKGAHGETGVGLVEVYDLDTGGAAQLANIATRGKVQTGDNVLIGGFIISGGQPAKMLVRATGPSSGVAGALQDPTLELHDSNGSVVANDGWREGQESEITATGIPPRDDREPSILQTLVPGNYTAVVKGKADSTGVAVVEAYNLQ